MTWWEIPLVAWYLQCWCSLIGGKPLESLDRGQEEGLASQQLSSSYEQSILQPNLQMACLWWYSRYWQSIDEAPSRYHARQGCTLELLHLCLQAQGCSWWTILRIVGMQDTWCHHSWRRASSLSKGLKYQGQLRMCRQFWMSSSYVPFKK